MKLLGRETGESIMMFEETLPAGTASLYHLHRDSDEVAWVLAGQLTFKIKAKAAGPGARRLFCGVPSTGRHISGFPVRRRAD